MRSRLVLWFIFVLLFGMGAIFFSKNGWTQPLENIAQKGLSPIRGILTRSAGPITTLFRALEKGQELERENVRQQREIERLSAEIVRLREKELENERLRTLLDYKDINPQWAFVAATIIGRDPSGLVQSIAIDKGLKDGVGEGMVVVAGNALVGKVISTFDSSAKVLLISDPRSSVNAMVQPSRAVGVVKGQPGSYLVMDYIRQSESISEGDLVITSGLGGGFPKGILIGQVAEVEGGDLEVFLKLQVRPATNFNKLEQVLVIANFTPGPLP